MTTDLMREVVIRELVKRDGYDCRYCFVRLEASSVQIDHVWPLSKGGANDIQNLCLSCRSCNTAKRDKIDRRGMPSDLAEPIDLADASAHDANPRRIRRESVKKRPREEEEILRREEDSRRADELMEHIDRAALERARTPPQA